MKRPIVLIAMLLLVGLLMAGCGALDPGAVLPGPTPLPGAAGTPLPDAQVAFVVDLPESTPADAQVSIEFVDIVTGVPYHTDRRAMTRSEDGHWRLDARMPAGSLLRYRYLLTAPEALSESGAHGQAVRYRVAHVPGPVQIEDQVAAWGQGSYQGPTGRILGRVYQPGGEPVPEIIVNAAGQSTFTDSEGRFRLEGLPVGLHNVVAYHPDGRYHVAQQGAILAENSTTPAEFEVRQAEEVTMTFQVTVPGNTPSGVPLRMAGSLLSLGSIFEEMPGGGEASAARMPQLVPVDGSTYLLLTRMYAGTDLRYKYTFGDGLWNAERTANGGFVTRQLIVPETDTTISDSVASWGAEAAREVRFDVNPPPNTPAGDEISLQINPFAWFEPLPMVAQDDGSWSYVLRGPLDFAGSFEYRFCRNFECGRAGGSPGDSAAGTLAAGGGQTVAEEISSWTWWSGPVEAEFARTEITARPDWRVGVEMAPLYRPTWAQYDQRSLGRVAELNTNNVTFTPAWILDDEHSVPTIEFDPRAARWRHEFEQAAEAAEEANLTLSLRPELRPRTGSLNEWWQTGSRDATWWTVWFDEYRSFLLSQANLARQTGAERLIISGAQIAPALPAGSLADGSPSGVPLDAESRWRQLLEEVRSVYSGQVAFEIELAESVRAVPPFLDAVDAVHVYWHYPLAEGSGAGLDELTQEAELGLQRVLAVVPADKTLVVSAEYLSLEDSAAACPQPAEGGCLPPAEFDAGAVVSDEPVNLRAQTEALQAVLRAAAAEPRVAGFSARRFYPLAALQDRSASVYGKPAADMLSYEYARLLGLD